MKVFAVITGIEYDGSGIESIWARRAAAERRVRRLCAVVNGQLKQGGWDMRRHKVELRSDGYASGSDYYIETQELRVIMPPSATQVIAKHAGQTARIFTLEDI